MGHLDQRFVLPSILENILVLDSLDNFMSLFFPLFALPLFLSCPSSLPPFLSFSCFPFLEVLFIECLTSKWNVSCNMLFFSYILHCPLCFILSEDLCILSILVEFGTSSFIFYFRYSYCLNIPFFIAHTTPEVSSPSLPAPPLPSLSFHH